MKILEYPDDYLRTKTKAVKQITPELIIVAEEMYKTMIEANGAGLAATQVGLDISLLVLEDSGKPLIMFNPVILQRAKDNEYGPEGCLSFPGITRIIRRPKDVTVKYRDVNNKMQYVVLHGFQARAMVHEYDHLFGKLFIDLEDRSDKTT